VCAARIERPVAPEDTMNLLVVGDGRMGRLVERLAPGYGFTVSGVLGAGDNADASALTPDRCQGIDVAIEFTTPSAVVANVQALAAAGVNAVVGTTGWSAHEPALREIAARAGIGVVAAANFSLGAAIATAVAARAALLLRGRDDYGAWVYEQHHAAKRDAPSGTALALVAAVTDADPQRAVDVASTRAGHIPGTHVVGFDGPAEQLTITHLVRDRTTFAHGALIAARWLAGRRGWFSMRDVLGLER
jgi:4-hydroxy-tetrahydrodipicolinate reductase